MDLETVLFSMLVNAAQSEAEVILITMLAGAAEPKVTPVGTAKVQSIVASPVAGTAPAVQKSGPDPEPLAI